jgi:hypothetical protein
VWEREWEGGLGQGRMSWKDTTDTTGCIGHDGTPASRPTRWVRSRVPKAVLVAREVPQGWPAGAGSLMHSPLMPGLFKSPSCPGLNLSTLPYSPCRAWL